MWHPSMVQTPPVRLSSALSPMDQHLSCAPTDMPDVNSMIAGLDVAIEYFKQSIPTVGQPESAAEGIRHDLLVIHTLAQCATIALHKGSAHQSPTSRSRCLTAANAIVGVFQAVKSEDLAFVNPILAVCG